MYIEFGPLVIENFKSFRGKHVIDLAYQGVTYIVGDNKINPRLYGNGSAKSTIWDALCWCLYGKTALSLRNPDIKPWSESGDPSVRVGVTIDDKNYTFQRTMNPNRFTVNGKDAADADIGASFDLFTNAILLPQGKPLFFDRKPTEKMDLFSEAIPLDRWDSRSKAAAEAAKGFEDAITELQVEERSKIGALDEINRSLSSIRQKSKEWAEESSKRINLGKKEIAKLEAELARSDKQLASAILAEDGALLEGRASEAANRKLRSTLSDINGKITGLQTQRRLMSGQYTELAKELKLISNAKSCPTCGQPIKQSSLADHKQHLITKIRTLDKEGNDTLGAMNKLIEERDRLEETAIKIANEIDTFVKKADEAQDARLRLQPEVTTLKRRIDEAYKVKEEVNPHLEQINTLSARKRSIQKDLDEIKIEIEDNQRKAEQHWFWVKGFKDIKLQLIEEILQELELATNSMVEEVGLEGWEIRFAIEKETKSETVQRLIYVDIRSPESKAPVRWEAFSGGEKQRLRLIGSLALSDVLLTHAGIETNLEVLDEPAVYWSSEGVQELCEFLAWRAKEQKKSLYYIEHNTVESKYFDDVITIVKDENGSRIETR